MIIRLAQCFGKGIEHPVAEAVIGQQVVPFGPLVEASNGEDGGNILVLVQIGKGCLHEGFERSRIFVVENHAVGPCVAVRLVGPGDGRYVPGRGVPSGREGGQIGDVEILVVPGPKLEGDVCGSHTVVGEFNVFGLVVVRHPGEGIVGPGSVVAHLL